MNAPSTPTGCQSAWSRVARTSIGADHAWSGPAVAMSDTPSASRSNVAVKLATPFAVFAVVVVRATPAGPDATESVTSAGGAFGLPRASSAATVTANGSPATAELGTEANRSAVARVSANCTLAWADAPPAVTATTKVPGAGALTDAIAVPLASVSVLACERTSPGGAEKETATAAATAEPRLTLAVSWIESVPSARASGRLGLSCTVTGSAPRLPPQPTTNASTTGASGRIRSPTQPVCTGAAMRKGKRVLAQSGGINWPVGGTELRTALPE